MAYTIFCDEGVTFTAAELLNVHFAQVKDRRFLEAMERRGGDLYVITMSPAFSDSYQAACEARDTLLSGAAVRQQRHKLCALIVIEPPSAASILAACQSPASRNRKTQPKLIA